MAESRLDNKNIPIFVLKNVIFNLICTGHFHVSKGTVLFFVWPITPGNFIRIFFHLHRMCEELLTIPHCVLSFPIKTTVRSIHLISAIIIQHSIFCTFQVTFSQFHIISTIFFHVINALITPSDFHCMNTLGTLCIICV